MKILISVKDKTNDLLGSKLVDVADSNLDIMNDENPNWEILNHILDLRDEIGYSSPTDFISVAEVLEGDAAC